MISSVLPKVNEDLKNRLKYMYVFSKANKLSEKHLQFLYTDNVSKYRKNIFNFYYSIDFDIDIIAG